MNIPVDGAFETIEGGRAALAGLLRGAPMMRRRLLRLSTEPGSAPGCADTSRTRRMDRVGWMGGSRSQRVRVTSACGSPIPNMLRNYLAQ